MIQIGKLQELQIEKIAPFGAFLGDTVDDFGDNAFLSKENLPKYAREGDLIDVFVYKDSQDRLTATIKKPLAQIGELAYMKVLRTKNFGAFLDWGIEKNLFLPKNEQAYRVEVGKSYLVGVFLDETLRICATTNIYDYLCSDSPYQKNDTVKGTVYLIKRDVGVFVAVDDKYYGLIPKDEYFEKIEPGDRLKMRVARVREDGKLDLSMRALAYLQMDKDAELILKAIRENNGFIPLNDKSDPNEIKRELKISKKAFKRAVGRLLKLQKIIQIDGGLKSNN